MRRWWSAGRPGIRAWSASSPGASRSASTGRPASPGWLTIWRRDRAVRWPGIDLGAAVIAARQAGILKTGGGHPMAAGFSLAPARLAEFHAFLDERLAAAALLPTRGRSVGGRHAGGAGRHDGTGASTGAAGAVRRRQRGADPGAAACPRGARRPGRPRGHRDPGVRGRRGRRAAAEGDAVPRARRCAGGDVAVRAAGCRCILPAICVPRSGTARSIPASSSPTWRRLDPWVTLRYPPLPLGWPKGRPW